MVYEVAPSHHDRPPYTKHKLLPIFSSCIRTERFFDNLSLWCGKGRSPQPWRSIPAADTSL